MNCIKVARLTEQDEWINFVLQCAQNEATAAFDAELLNQTIEMMAMDRQRLYQEVAKQYSVTGEQLKKSTELFDELSKKYDDLSAKYADQIKQYQELLDHHRTREEKILGYLTMQSEGFVARTRIKSITVRKRTITLPRGAALGVASCSPASLNCCPPIISACHDPALEVPRNLRVWVKRTNSPPITTVVEGMQYLTYIGDGLWEFEDTENSYTIQFDGCNVYLACILSTHSTGYENIQTDPGFQFVGYINTTGGCNSLYAEYLWFVVSESGEEGLRVPRCPSTLLPFELVISGDDGSTGTLVISGSDLLEDTSPQAAIGWSGTVTGGASPVALLVYFNGITFGIRDDTLYPTVAFGTLTAVTCDPFSLTFTYDGVTYTVVP